MLGYSLYGIPHPNLGDWLEPRFDKIEFLVRYSGVNQRAILANDITTAPFKGSTDRRRSSARMRARSRLGSTTGFSPILSGRARLTLNSRAPVGRSITS